MLNALNTGHLIIFFSTAFFLIASYAVLVSAFLPLTGIHVIDILALDTHYKYFVVFLVPTSAYFVIANWVGWQYYRNT
ncbi:hypothetical protein EV421DRAFT_1775320 [Armillaria borealis]|uniref:Uncharacterized protein n=1 Tax=Armillaria borealis TaxID=47425 RepID=A0AA39JY85_9AGAR|nr:hypothetical protein EV421DRAFT_1775320 [Armillaria borealis]